MPIDTLGRLDPDDVRRAEDGEPKGPRRDQRDGVQMQLDDRTWRRGLGYVKLDELNASLRRGLHTKNGEYERPLELVLARLASRR